MSSVAIIDYGGSNLRSVAKAIEHAVEHRQRVSVTSEPRAIAAAARIVFPGQGAIGECMRRLHAAGIDDAIRRAVTEKPYLGICLGLQTLLARSDENDGTPGLGVIAGHVARFPAGMREPGSGERLKIPHMGWNTIELRKSHPLWKDIEDGTRFYFVHSYYVRPEPPELTAASTCYGVEFASAVASGYMFATQFHPEKSQRPGLQLLRNFLAWDGG